MKNESILITGGAGFIGSNLVARLVEAGATVHLLLKKTTDVWRINQHITSKNISIHYVDLSDATSLASIVASIQPSIIYHLAAHGASHSQNEPRQILESDLFGTLNLLTACQPINYKLFVNFGSSSEYGFSDTPMIETQPLRPNSYYALAKAAQTLLASYEAAQYNKPIITARLFSVYGPYESAHKLFPTLFEAVLSKLPLTLTDKSAAHDFIYIDDVVNGLMQIDALIKLKGEVVNFGTGKQITLEEVLETAEQVTGQKINVNWDQAKAHRWDSSHWVADITKASQALMWHPTSFKDGLESYWQWYKKHSAIYSKVI